MPIHFGEFELHPENCELRRCGRPVKLEHLPMELLILLLEQPGNLVRRETINEKLWGDGVFVETEHSINTAMNKLRFILRDDPKRPRYIRTVVGKGYCFIADVNKNLSGDALLAACQSEPTLAKSSDRNEGSHLTLGSIEPKASDTLLSVIVDPLQPQIYSTVDASSHPVRTPQAGTSNGLWRVAGIGTLAAVFVAIAVFAYYARGRVEPLHAAEQVVRLHSVAVLPFRNLAQNADQDYLVDAMTDQVITDLARSTSHRVISRRSAMHFKNLQVPLKEIAQDLGVETIVEGSYIRSGKRVRITAQLLDAVNDRHLWAQTYEESDQDLLAIQDQVANDIARQVSLSLGDRFSRSKLRPVNPKAHDAYLRGRYLWNARTLRELQASIDAYTIAIREDPQYAEAFAALAESYIILGTYGTQNSSDALVKAQFAVERALQLDPDLGEAHTAAAAIKTACDWDWAGAEQEFQRAIQLSPGDSRVHHWYSLHLSRLGHVDEAEAEMKRALALDPLSPIINTDWAETAYWARRPIDASQRIEATLNANPNFAEAHLVKGKILIQQNRYKEGMEEFRTASKLFNGTPNLDFLQGYVLARQGMKGAALEIARELEARSKQHHVRNANANIAAIYCGLDQTDDAIKWLNLGYTQHDRGINMLGIDPLFDPCRTDARFNKLLRTFKLST